MTIAFHDAEVASRFDLLAQRFKPDVADDDCRLTAVLKALRGFERPRVLDLGCGKGRFARPLKRWGATVVGLDVSSRMLAEAAGLPRVKGTGHRLPFADAAFDAVVAIECLEHAGDVSGLLDEARRTLRPGGRLIVVDKNSHALDARRPWLPAVVVKWIDERRGLWMYPAGGPVTERWFSVRGLARTLIDRFESVSIEHLLSPDESRRAIFRTFPRARKLACWTATAPGGDL